MIEAVSDWVYYRVQDFQKLYGLGDYAIHRTCGVARSPEWARTKRTFEKTHPKICAFHGGKKKIQLHHKHPFHVHPELENDLNNLVWACEEPGWNCHLKFCHLGNFRTKWNANIDVEAPIWLARFTAKTEQEIFPAEVEASA